MKNFFSRPDNWALIYSQKLALKHSLPLLVCFCLVPRFLGATFRHYNFMMEGLKEVEKVCMMYVCEVDEKNNIWNPVTTYSQHILIAYLVPSVSDIVNILQRTLNTMSTSQTLHQLRIPFHLLLGTVGEQLPLLISQQQVSAVVCDFSPLRLAMAWVKGVAQQLDSVGVPLIQVSLSLSLCLLL